MRLPVGKCLLGVAFAFGLQAEGFAPADEQAPDGAGRRMTIVNGRSRSVYDFSGGRLREERSGKTEAKVTGGARDRSALLAAIPYPTGYPTTLLEPAHTSYPVPFYPVATVPLYPGPFWNFGPLYRGGAFGPPVLFAFYGNGMLADAFTPVSATPWQWAPPEPWFGWTNGPW